jgi:ribose 5-phosphate isomerase A
MSSGLVSDALKQRAGEAAAALVEAGMTVGLGTGSTAAQFVRALAARKLDIRGVSTSEATEKLAVSLGIKTLQLDAASQIDLTVDGADEINPALVLIKGGGAALLREKLVWEASKRCVCIADASKRVPVLGRFPLPVEIVRFGAVTTAARLGAKLKDAGVEGELRLREGVITDGGNLIYDLHGATIERPTELGTLIKQTTGVVEHGLFLGLCDLAIVAGETDITRLSPNI